MENKDLKKVGFTCGAFDLVHPGHIRMFKECKLVCNYLIVGVQTDPSIDRPVKNKPIQTLEERIEMLKAIKYIDELIIYTTEDSLYKLLQKLQPNIRILGEDWKGKKFTGHDLPIEIFFNSRKHSLSTSNLRKRVCEAKTKSV